jgi:hypothetical protein
LAHPRGFEPLTSAFGGQIQWISLQKSTVFSTD